ncbi:sensor histidine kinase [Brevundimonas sp. Root1423]|uniref:sensor histidine kinase n=1 Tax=Brevundimonas sp. Root1423 TaxID=1736462 RepID=UPI00138F1847|nr:histidine kinase [Brevundimonas sp. Root1423]
MLLTLALWGFCFLTYYAITFLWTNWAPPAWLLGFNLAATLSGIGVSLALAAALMKLDPRRGAGRIAGAVALTLVAALVQTLIDQQIWRELASQFMQPTPRPTSLAGVFADFAQAMKTPIAAFRLLSFLWVFGLFAAAVILLLELGAGRRRERQLVEARNMAQTAQLAALRYQLDPHFLFNCLNNVSSLVVTGRAAEAETMMMKLSDMLRTKLAGDPHLPKTLGEELDDVCEYLAIEGIRFGDALEIDVDCPSELLGAEVPGFILQPLAENAVKHGLIADGTPRAISIEAERRDEALVISIRNERTANSGDALEGFGLGLTNTRQRLQALYGPDGRLETEADDKMFTARVVLPLDRAADRREDAILTGA